MSMVSGTLIGVGDLAVFTSQLVRAGTWGAVITGLGALTAVLGYALPLRLWMPDLRADRRALFVITVVPVATVIVVQSLSLVVSPSAKLPPASNHPLAGEGPKLGQLTEERIGSRSSRCGNR